MSKLNTVASQEQKIAFLSAACQGDGDAVPLYAYADWLEEQGSKSSVRRAAQVRRDTTAYSRMVGRTLDGTTWLVWYARYQLELVAEGLFGRTRYAGPYTRFAYRGNLDAAGDPVKDDGSMEYCMRMNGWYPSLKRSVKVEERLGRVIEALGYGVEWLE